MANKRMFSLSVVDTDNFIDMPISSRLLYYELGMRADDDGFVDSVKKILAFTGLKEDDLKVLITKKFLIPFESGVIVIRHWRLNNYLQKDRYKETIYQEEKSQLEVDNTNVYSLYTECKHSIDKNSIDKNSIDKNSCNSIMEFYNNNIGSITPYQLEILESYLKDMEEEVIILAMKKSVEANKRNIQYIKAILNNWIKKGIKTVLDAENEEQEYKNTQNIKETKKEYQNYEQRDIKNFDNFYAN